MKYMDDFFLIAGPCVIESEECLHLVASTLQEITDQLKIDFYFKASFDKANRTSLSSYRGPGLEKGLKMLQEIKDAYGVRIATDIHEPWQADPVSKVADIIQIPAFLCRQTDLLVSAAKTGRIVNVKKAQFLAPWDMKYVVEKLIESGANQIMLCERGTCFGYNNLVVDMTGIYEMKKFGFPVLFDATHSVQKPGGNGKSTSGNRSYIEPLAKAALGAGANGLFMEIHPTPNSALSDGPNMLPLNEAETFLRKIKKLFDILEENE